MPRYAVSHIDWNDNELTTDIVEAVDMFEAIKKSPKACSQIGYVFDEPGHVFHKTVGQSKQLKILKEEAFNGDGMINAVLIPDPAPTQPDIVTERPKNCLL